jgi:hypothetical protein
MKRMRVVKGTEMRSARLRIVDRGATQNDALVAIALVELRNVSGLFKRGTSHIKYHYKLVCAERDERKAKCVNTCASCNK